MMGLFLFPGHHMGKANYLLKYNNSIKNTLGFAPHIHNAFMVGTLGTDITWSCKDQMLLRV